MKQKRKLDTIRLAAVIAILLAILYYYLNVFSPGSIPSAFRVGMPRAPYTLLIVGTDVNYDSVTQKVMTNLPGRTDTILLVRVDPVRSRVNILSIPRDTYVSIPGYGYQKINAANVYGGMKAVKGSIFNLTHQNVEHFIEIKPTAVMRMVDVLGGVTLFVEKDMRYIDRAQGLNINLKSGWQKLSGKQAHDYIRFRHDMFGDIGRVGRQQTFLKALSNEFKKPKNIIKAPFAIMLALREIDTNLPLGQSMRLANFIRTLSPEDIHTATIPGGSTTEAYSGSVWVPNYSDLEKILREFF